MGGQAIDGRPEWGRWPRVDGTPRRELRSLLAGGYTGFSSATEPRRLRLVATASVPLVVKIRDSAWRPPGFVHGVHGSYSVVDGDCAPEYLEVRLAPLGAYVLLGRPMDELSGQFVDLTELFGPSGRRLGERVRAESTWRRRFDIMDEFLLRRLDTGPRPTPEMVWAWRRLVGSGGTVAIRQLAAEVGWSHKHLITKFKREIGLAPKTAARLVRFQQALGRLDQQPSPRWEQVAADGGYADQAHLVRDFREFTGSTPAALWDTTRAGKPASAPHLTR
ncbi:MAG TPA: helix-turn-helix domain-containing protein [Streptosporangiaceae bacterium]|nr:helix-turn-helix domain-containing protein [Streptosporangiaceae bacterium]